MTLCIIYNDLIICIIYNDSYLYGHELISNTPIISKTSNWTTSAFMKVRAKHVANWARIE